MRKLSLFLVFTLCLGLMFSFPASAEEVVTKEGEFLPVVNGDFEVADENGLPVGYPEIHGLTHITDALKHGGNSSLDLSNTADSKDAQAMQTVQGLIKGATYEISAWLYTPNADGIDFGFWIYYTSLDHYDWADVTSHVGIDKSIRGFTPEVVGEWVWYSGEFVPPENAKSAHISLRNRTHPSTLYIDDFQIRLVKKPKPIDADTDEVFYYSEWEEGVLSGSPASLEAPENASAEISLIMPDGTETHKETLKDLSKGVNYVFRTEWMEEKVKRHHIRLKVFGADGTEIQNEEFPVYRVDRPTYLSADGTFRKNGKEVNLTGAYYGNTHIIKKNPEKGGVTVLQLISPPGADPLPERMNMAYEQGMFVLLNIYSGKKSAGHPDMIETTKKMVEAYKDHPALFGWKVQDEPYQKGNSAEELMLAYETIRSIDPHHPVYIDDSPSGGYAFLFRFCDILDIDYYGGSNANSGRLFTELFDIASKASKGRKPFSILLQFFEYGGILPTVDELRHQVYQTLFSGASGYFFYSLGTHSEHVDKTPMIEWPVWQDVVNKWAPWERQFMFDCFVNGKNKLLDYKKTNDVIWATFTDDKDIYAICLNRNKATPTTAEIPLVDGAGLISVEGFDAVRMTGEEMKLSGSGTLTLNLTPLEASVWKITPNTPLDTSGLKATKFRDMLPYSWAYNAVATLEEKGIVNRISENWYGPAENITRGDYAMFLVRTLGLTEGAGDNFADVDPDAEYAKELAIGKTAGIINGVGDNKFNPEAAISRQDMMTMTSRALKLAGAADLSAFADSGIIADYAQSHVAAMVAEGLIKGNADGTINPLGNTKRAEAAVIMQRLLNK
ncbi:MAG: S-layer homology domain-containing protein [Clostridia bacterium]|nr:S-layer homology domain-containing protein [Clostridia bacterium]